MWSIIVFVFRWSNHNDINSHPLFFWKWHQLPSSALDSCSDCNWAWRSCLQGVTQPNDSQFDYMVGKSAFIAKAGKTLHWFDYLMQNELQLHGSIFIYMYTVSWRTPGLPIVFKQLLDPQSRIIFFHAAACWHVVNEPSSLHEKEPHLLIGLIFILFKCVHVYIWIQSNILLPTQHIKENQWKLGWIYPFMVDF